MSAKKVLANILGFRLVLNLVFTFAPFIALGQQQMQDVVYLKNGSIIRGEIIEQIPNQTIKIKTADGSVFVYSMSDIERIVKEPRVVLSSLIERKPVGSFGILLNPLGFAQLGPMIQTEFRIARTMVVGPYARFVGLGLVSHALSEYDELIADAVAIGGSVKLFLGEIDQKSRWVVATNLEYGFGQGKDFDEVYNTITRQYDDASYNFSYIGLLPNVSYRWRFDSPWFISLGVTSGVGIELEDHRYYPSKVEYSKDIYFIGMLEFNVGLEW